MTQFTHVPYFGEFGYVQPDSAASASRFPWKILAVLTCFVAIILAACWFASQDEVKTQQSETAKANDRANLAEQANKPRRLL